MGPEEKATACGKGLPKDLCDVHRKTEKQRKCKSGKWVSAAGAIASHHQIKARMAQK